MRYNKAIIIFSSITVLLAVLGFTLLLVSSINIKKYVDKYLTYEQVNSEVVSYAKKDNGKLAIVVEYKINGESYLLESKIYHRHALEMGEKINILYNSDEPSDAIWMPNDENNIRQYLLLVFSIILIASSISVGLFDYKLINNNTLLEYVRDDNGFYNDKELLDDCDAYEEDN